MTSPSYLRRPDGTWQLLSGDPNSLAIGTVTTGAVGSNAVASITGNPPNQVLNLTLPRGAQGTQGLQGNPGVSSIDPSSYELRGTGFPEGVVTANPGVYYTDTNATNGAVRWYKASGTGNTGWKVIYGDTGWREVSSIAGAAYSTTNWLVVNRFGDIVTWEISADANAVWNQTFSTPSGFFPFKKLATVYPYEGFQLFQTHHRDTIGAGNGALGFRPGNDQMYLQPSGPQAQVRIGIGQYKTNDPWPSVLPGNLVP